MEKNIDKIILDWVKINYLLSNFNQELENYIYLLRQNTFDEASQNYLDYKLNIWKYIEIAKTLDK